MSRKCFLFCLGMLLGIQLMTLQSQAYTNSSSTIAYGQAGDDEETSENLPGATYDPQSPFDYPNYAEPERTETQIQEEEAREPVDEIIRSSRFEPNLRGD